MSDQPQPSAQERWRRIMADYHARYPETARILAVFAEAERIHREAWWAMQPVKVGQSDHANRPAS